MQARQRAAAAITAALTQTHAITCDEALLRSFRGVGPKCAHLVLSIACGQPRISVDTHVHRVTNRWGYVEASRPEATMRALEGCLPPALLGRHQSPARAVWQARVHRLGPHCSTCPLLSMCRQVGVTSHR